MYNVKLQVGDILIAKEDSFIANTHKKWIIKGKGYVIYKIDNFSNGTIYVIESEFSKKHLIAHSIYEKYFKVSRKTKLEILNERYIKNR